MCKRSVVSLLLSASLWALAYRRSSYAIDAVDSRLGKVSGDDKILRLIDYRLDDWPISEMLANALLANRVIQKHYVIEP